MNTAMQELVNWVLDQAKKAGAADCKVSLVETAVCGYPLSRKKAGCDQGGYHAKPEP